jgi:putative endonuclease
MFYTYVLESLKNKRHYTGSTNNLRRRLKEHNDGVGGKYTSDNRPYHLLYYEAYLHEKDARQAERFYKTGYGREVLKSKLENYLKISI